MRVVVIGAGVGGLAAAIRLRAAGHDVVVLERGAEPGGKVAVIERDGFVFDAGPSLVTLPHVFDELFRAAGTSLAEQVPMVRLDPQFHYHWPDGRSLVMRDGGCDEPGYDEFIDRGRRVWEVSERTFFAGPMSGPFSLARRLRRPRDLTEIDATRSLHDAATAAFTDRHMVQWAGRYATYSGSSPFAAPATLGCIAYAEHEFGCWYPVGGLRSLRDALVRVAVASGVELRCDAEVGSIDVVDSRVSGVTLVAGDVVPADVVPADVVVANADAQHVYGELLPSARALRRVRRATPSTSGFVVLAGVRGRTPGIAHHNVWFSGDMQREFAQLDAGQMADDPTIYACISAVTDPSQAPSGDENWFVLVNAPAGADVDRTARTAQVFARLRRAGIDLESRVAFTDTITPADFERRYRSPGGSIYGSSSNGRRAAFVRPANRGAVEGLYLVGGSSHPGGGLPLVTISARIVADMVEDDLARADR